MNKKFYIEKRAELKEKMQAILNKAQEEKRAISQDEDKEFKDLQKEIANVDDTLRAIELMEGDVEPKPTEPTQTQNEQRGEDVEERAFLNYVESFVTGNLEARADSNLTLGANGAIIPSAIVNKILETVKDRSPIYAMAEKYNVAGNLSIPFYDETSGKITMAYANEFEELTSTSAKFKSIELGSYLAGVLTKISKSLINKAGFDLKAYIIDKVAQAIVDFIEHEIINGTTGKILGLQGVTQKVTAASATAITADELIDLQDTILDVYQPNSIFIMNRTTRTALRKLKDGQGNYLLNRDFQAKWGYTLLGKDVYTTDEMPKVAAGKDVIFYGDMSGLSAKIAENMNMQVLQEKYATQHALGVVGWVELDVKVSDTQKISKLTMKTA